MILYQNSMPLACPRGILKELCSGKCIITILSRAKNDIKNTKSRWKNGKIFGKLAGKMPEELVLEPIDTTALNSLAREILGKD